MSDKTSHFSRNLIPGKTPETGKAPVGDWQEPIQPAEGAADPQAVSESFDDFRQGI